jgi:hypothetical protein
MNITVPQTCTICRHPQRLKIEQALVSGTPLRDIAGRYGTTKTVVARHRTHIAATIARHTQARDLARTGTLLDDVRTGEGRAERLYGQAEEILAGALKDKDRRTALQAIRAAVDVMSQARGYLELRGELTNELGRDRTAVAMSIQIVCPAAPEGAVPRITYTSDDALDGCTEEIGLRQLG